MIDLAENPMTKEGPLRVLSPVLTPFNSDLSTDSDTFVRHCRWLLRSGVGLAPFGTNSEAASMSNVEKIKLLDDLVVAGLPTSRMIPGTGSCALSDTVEMTRSAVVRGCAGVLLLPPFYYKQVLDDGLFAYFAEVIERIGDARLRIYLYHIPPVAQIPISFALIERLLDRYPSTVAGIKDSSGDWSNTRELIRRFQPEGFKVFAGSESFLLQTLRAGGQGCITATANVNPLAISQLARDWQVPDAEAQQRRLDLTREIIQRHGLIPAMKAVMAHAWNRDELRRPRPPLMALDSEHARTLQSELRAIGFQMD